MIAPDDPRHGTRNGYVNLGCRCDRCRAANTEGCRAWMHADPARLARQAERERERYRRLREGER